MKKRKKKRVGDGGGEGERERGKKGKQVGKFTDIRWVLANGACPCLQLIT